ncbi:hypothetical protein JVU11DRAFT_3285 [Chiua virens]|nr:hypothetical protein JVU11DRAFT_12293 [Chiua virens]KAG9315642.1 hypothetical protein JVU11DRAFT_3285 [Chiua virens]
MAGHCPGYDYHNALFSCYPATRRAVRIIYLTTTNRICIPRTTPMSSLWSKSQKYELVGRLTGHKDAILCLAVSNARHLLASGGQYVISVGTGDN